MPIESVGSGHPATNREGVVQLHGWVLLVRSLCPPSLSDRTLGREPGRRGSIPRVGAASSLSSLARPWRRGVHPRSRHRALWSPGSISIDTCITSRPDRGQHPGTPPSGRSSARRAPVWEAGGRRGSSCRPDHRFHQRVAQPEERQHRKLEAAGAVPATLTAVFSLGVVVQRLRTRGCGPRNMGSTPIHPSTSGIPNGEEPPRHGGRTGFDSPA